MIQKVTWTRRQRADRRGRRVLVPRQPDASEDLHVRRPADLLRRLGRRLVGPRVLRHAGADGRGEVVARRRRQLDARDRRARRRRRRRRARRSSRSSPAGGARSREAPRSGSSLALASRRRSRCRPPRRRTRRCCRTVPAGERHAQRAAAAGRADLQRGGRAALRDRLGHRRGRPAGDGRPAAPVAGEPGHAARPAASAIARGLVPRLLARDLGRRPSRCAARSRSRSGRTRARRRSS